MTPETIMRKYGRSYYLAGKMSHMPAFNFPAFDMAAEDLRGSGFTIVSPAELDDPAERERALASPDGNPHGGKYPKSYFMRRDLEIVVCKVDGIIVLEDWQESDGALDETYVAHKLDMPVLGPYPILNPLDPKDHPLVKASVVAINGVDF